MKLIWSCYLDSLSWQKTTFGTKS